MELRSRSRSNTPYLMSEEVQTTFQQNTETQEIFTRSYSTRNKSSKLNLTSSDELFITPPKLKTDRPVRRTRQKTSDYSSEEGEDKITSTKSNENRSHHLTASTGTSASNGQIKTAFQIYKEAGEYWNKYPKTDYTYSRHSKDRFEVAPGIVAMPNMSRRSIHRETTDGVSETSQSHYFSNKASYDEYRENNNRQLKPIALFKDKSEVRTSVFTRVTQSVVFVFLRIYMLVYMLLSFVYGANTAAFLWLGRWYYRFVSRILLLDTWLLQRADQKKRWGPFIAVLLLPLILFAGWWLFSSVSSLPFAPIPSTAEEPVKSDIKMEHLENIVIASQMKENVNIEDVVIQILNNPSFENIIKKHLNQMTIVTEKQSEALNLLKNDVNDVRTQMNMVNMKSNKLAVEMNKCCKRQYIFIENHITKVFSELIGGKSGALLTSDDISRWLHAVFVAKQDLELSLSNVAKHLHADFDKTIEASARRIMDDISLKISAALKEQLDLESNTGTDGGISEGQVKRIVKQALAVYDADKTGMVDYALETSGGQVISTRCTESYNAKTAVLSVLGIPLWYPTNTPRTAITPGVTPGNCWAFEGFPGFLVIKLSSFVKVTAFSLEHIPKSIALGGNVDSAPRNFTIFGLKQENDHDPWLFGEYSYDAEGTSLQYFTVQNEGPPVNLIELRIDSNNGNLVYTCLYRFRVHGNMSDNPA